VISAALEFKVRAMSMWILAIVLVLIFAGLGFAQGAIRSTISLVGLIVALLLAVPFGGLLRPLMGQIGVTNPVWQAIVPAVVAFLIIYLVISGLSFFVHHKVYLMYKYKRDDADRIRWERMNRHTGASIGVLMGVIFFLAVSGTIYAAGYLTVQLSSDSNPGTIRFINSVREDMAASGFDKAAAKFQPASNVYYETADVLGLLYHNPLLQSRLATYPGLLTIGQRPEFQEIGNDKEYNDLIFGKPPVTDIINHERTQAILGNQEIMSQLLQVDRRDLEEYLRTGKSPKFEEQEILGIWNLDKDAVLTFIRKSNPDIRARELRELKAGLDAAPPISLIATPEKKVFVRGGEAGAPAPAEEPAADPADDPMARYRTLSPQVQAAPAAAPAPVAASPVPTFSGEGTWEEEAGQYIVSLTDASGTEVKGTARIRADEMVLTVPGASLVFAKQ
jgi:hypothetical protein